MNHDGLFDIVTYVAEVTDKRSPGDTYKRNKTGVIYPPGKRNNGEETEISSADMLFAIDVAYTVAGRPQYIQNVKPFNSNIKQIPITGESVLVFQTINHESTPTESYPQWYYMYPIAIPSNVNTNILPTLVDDIIQDSKYTPRDVSPLQPYRGDLTIEGRYGNSIRFGSTIDYQNDYSVTGTWSGNKNGDPILIISNGRPYKTDKQFVTEDVSKDNSSLYLTSTQTLNTLKLSQPLTTYGISQGSQFVGVADRVILQAKTEAAVIDANEVVILNTPGDVLIGGDDADQPIPHGSVLEEILMHLANAVLAGTTVSGVMGIPNATLEGIQAIQKIQSLNSTKYKIRKT